MVAQIHKVLGFLFLTIALLQFAFAGFGAFGGTDGWKIHENVGHSLEIVALLLLILAAVGRREALAASGALLVLTIVQSLLAGLGQDSSAVFGALHPLNGLLILFVAHQAARGLPLPIGGPPAPSRSSAT